MAKKSSSKFDVDINLVHPGKPTVVFNKLKDAESQILSLYLNGEEKMFPDPTRILLCDESKKFEQI